MMHRIRKALLSAFAALALAAGASTAAASYALAAPAQPVTTYTDTSLQASPPTLEQSLSLGSLSHTATTVTATLTPHGYSPLTSPSVDQSGGPALPAGGTATISGSTLTVNFASTPAPGTYTFAVSDSPVPAHGATEQADLVITVSGSAISQVASYTAALNVPNTVYPDVQFSGTETILCQVAGPPCPAGLFTTALPLSGAIWSADDLPSGLAPSGLVTGGVLTPGTAVPGTYTWATVSGTIGSGSGPVTASETFSLAVSGHAVHSISETGTVVDFSGMCLDVRNAFGHAAAGQLLQIWKCGAAGGKDQVFTFDSAAHTLTYQGLCVDDPVFDGQAVLAACNASGPVTRSGQLYRFGNGAVLDDAGFGKGSGNRVLAYAHNGGANQDWSLPQ